MANQSDRLQLERRLQTHRREWKVQRAGWVAGIAILAAAVAGLLGAGPLSASEAASADGDVKVAYDRFVHYNNQVVLRVTLNALPGTTEPIALKLPQAYLDRTRLHRIHPEPLRSLLTGDGTVFEFERVSGTDQAAVDFHLEFCKVGSAPGSVELVGHESVAFTQFVYP
jgi:hypothetical protein